MPIRAVVFDLGGVLIDWNPDYLYRKIIPDSQLRQSFLQEICTGHWNLQQDAGRSLAEGTALLTTQYPQHADWIEAFYGRWTEMLAGPLTEGVALLENLRQANVPLYALTNWSAETFPYAKANFPFLQHFRHILVSGEIGLIKPSPAIYQRMFEVIAAELPDLRAEELVFLDDAVHNVSAARDMGWKAIHHTAAEQSRHELQQLGLPVTI